MIPRLGSVEWDPTHQGQSICVLLLNRIYFVFETFSVSLFALNQSEAFINSWLAILYNSLKSLEEIWNVVSSAKSIVKSLSDILARSLIRIKNRIGPSTEPCGTPVNKVLLDELTPFITEYCVRSLR